MSFCQEIGARPGKDRALIVVTSCKRFQFQSGQNLPRNFLSYKSTELLGFTLVIIKIGTYSCRFITFSSLGSSSSISLLGGHIWLGCEFCPSFAPCFFFLKKSAIISSSVSSTISLSWRPCKVSSQRFLTKKSSSAKIHLHSECLVALKKSISQQLSKLRR